MSIGLRKIEEKMILSKRPTKFQEFIMNIFGIDWIVPDFFIDTLSRSDLEEDVWYEYSQIFKRQQGGNLIQDIKIEKLENEAE